MMRKVRIAKARNGPFYWVEAFSDSGYWDQVGGKFFLFHWSAKRYALKAQAGLIAPLISYETIC